MLCWQNLAWPTNLWTTMKIALDLINLCYYAEMKLTCMLLKVFSQQCRLAVGSEEWRYRLDDEWHPECAFHLICSVLQFTDGSPFILLAPNSYNWVSKCMGPHIRAGPCWEGIWAALLAGRECVCRVHQSLPSPGELNKLIGRLVAASSRHCGPYSSQHRAQKALQWASWKDGPEATLKELCGGISLFFEHTLPDFVTAHNRASNSQTDS